jgi:hypothetical protein
MASHIFVGIVAPMSTPRLRPLATLAVATLSLVLGGVDKVNAAVIQIGSQSAFSASGTIVQNTNWDSFGSGYFFPGSPYTVGDLTFIQGGQNLIGGTGTSYDLARNLFTDNLVLGTTALSANTYDLFGLNAGNFLNDGTTTFTVTTNLGTYTFNDTVLSAVNQAPLTFFGYQATGGEYFTSIQWSSPSATGITDIQLGNTTNVPGPLPVLGAAAAFSYSRKLRKRLRGSNAPVASTDV